MRLGILLGLYYLKTSWFTELVESTGLDKAELYRHLKQLEKEGYIQIKYVPTISGKRTKVIITEKGEEVINEVIKLLSEKENE